MLLHADADAFFASVEARDRPELIGRPFAVASSVVMCASYAARALGVHAGLPVGQARRRWPELVVVPPRVEAYDEASARLFAAFHSVTALVEPGSMEEAFLDVTALAPTAAEAADVAVGLRTLARASIGLPVSVGVGRTKLLAKVASRRAKPDGLVVIAEDAEDHVRTTLRLDELWGVGPTTRERLRASGLHDLPAVRAAGADVVEDALGRLMGRRVFAMASGTDDSTIRLPQPPRSVSRSRTISPATRQRSRLEAVLADCLARLGERLDEEARLPTGLDLFLRYDDGADVVRRAPLVVTDRVTRARLDAEVSRLLDDTAYEEDGRGVALIGVTAHLPKGST